MDLKHSILCVLTFVLWVAPQGKAQTPSPQSANTVISTPSNNTPAATKAPTVDEVLDRVVAKESALVGILANYTPLVETYIQNLKDDDNLGAVPKDDHYFLGKLDLRDGITEHSLLPEPGFATDLKNVLTQFYSVRYLPNGFAQMILVDGKAFDRDNYTFEYVRQEFLGEVKCLVFDVSPTDVSQGPHFQGRIWVEDKDYNIVRFNGTYTGSSVSKLFFHFDSWREQMGPGLWLPAYVYSEESDMGYFMGRRHLKFKGQTRIWGYNIHSGNGENEFTSMIVESDKVEDNGDVSEHMTPVLSLRAWQRQAEDNVLHRMQKAGLIAPEGEVDKVLTTVVSNLEITNNLSIEPDVRVRVLLTSPLESFSIGHTIVLSRGLVDVLPDEASLAMVLAHELAHIYLDHRLDTKYAFNDRMLFDDTQVFNRVHIKRNDKEEREADERAMDFLANSPYKDKLGNAGLFLRALAERSSELPNLLTPHMGNPMADGKNVKRMKDLMGSAPELESNKVDQIAALPLGGRVRVDPWDNTLELVKTKPVALLSAREKMPFEVAPVYLYLTRQKDVAAKSNN
jgi:Peptidase family M48